MANYQMLKVDATALGTNGNNDALIIFNINIPEQAVFDLAQFVPALQRAQDFLVAELGEQVIYYQLTATYFLVHKLTGAQRLWTGSFFPKGNAAASLADFQRFNPNTFVDIVSHTVNQDTILEKLSWTNLDSNWQFDRLASVIVNAQANLTWSHPVMTRRNLAGRGGRRRAHVTFPLP